jgi:hypothetical protein
VGNFLSQARCHTPFPANGFLGEGHPKTLLRPLEAQGGRTGRRRRVRAHLGAVGIAIEYALLANSVRPAAHH